MSKAYVGVGIVLQLSVFPYTDAILDIVLAVVFCPLVPPPELLVLRFGPLPITFTIFRLTFSSRFCSAAFVPVF
jgi:hypothetical protein